MKHLLFFTILIGLLGACSKGNEDVGIPTLDGNKLSEISKSFCAVGEKLVELNLDPVPLQFEFLNSSGTILAFINGTGACALSKDVNDNWGDGWFGLQIHATCLPNSSFWKITDGYNANDTRYYKLDSADPSGLPTMDMWGSRTLNTTYARDHAGLHVMKCSAAASKPTH